MKRIIIPLFLLLVFLAGCSKCVLIRSEYYDVTGKILTPKPDTQEIQILTDKIDKPYQEIGAVKVLAPWGTSRKAIDAELKRRGREGGADALIDVVYGEDRSNDIVLCGKLVATRRNVSATARAVIFIPTQKETQGSGDKDSKPEDNLTKP